MAADVTLKEYTDARFSDLLRTIDGTRNAMEKRLDGMNEFRDSLKDQAEKFASKESLDAIERQVQELRVIGGGAAGRAAGLAQWYGWLVAAATLAVYAINVLRK